MNRAEFGAYISETYNVDKDCPWERYPNFAVFRHGSSRKWFAVIMDLPGSKLGLQDDNIIDVVNLKCDPVLIGSLLMEPGFFPAYHMNKGLWISVVLDGSVPDEKLKMLLDMSFEATAEKKKRNI